MIQVFYGEDRLKIEQEIKKLFGENYEVFEGENLTENDLPSLLLGNTLFSEQRNLLIKDLSKNEVVWEKFADYLKTEHQVVIWEMKVGKNSLFYKTLNKAGVKFTEYKKPFEKNIVFDIYDVALRDGKKAVKMCEEIENTQDPFMFVGLIVSKAIEKYNYHAGPKEKRVLKELSKLDVEMKTTSLQPWTLVKSFLLQVSSW